MKKGLCAMMGLKALIICALVKDGGPAAALLLFGIPETSQGNLLGKFCAKDIASVPSEHHPRPTSSFISHTGHFVKTKNQLLVSYVYNLNCAQTVQ